jgi:PleD family two-component response regulator
MSDNRHRADLKLITLWLPIETHRALHKFATEQKTSMSEIIKREIYRVTQDIQLTSQDYLEIAEEIRKNEQRGRPKRV